MNLSDRELGIGEDKETMGRIGGKAVSSKTLTVSLLMFIEGGFDICVHPLSSINHHN